MPKMGTKLIKEKTIFKGKYRNLASLAHQEKGWEGICLLSIKTLESKYLVQFHLLSPTEKFYSKE